MYEDCLARLPDEARSAVRAALSEALLLPDAVSVVIFGSYAKGTETPESDLDVAVFFDNDDSCLLDRYRRLVKLASSPFIDIQFQAFSARELDAPCGIVEEIVEYGIEYK
jgi:predicted nucleotidyltransferase